MRKYRYIPVLLLTVLTMLFAGCTKEAIVPDEPLNEKNSAILTITTRALDHGYGTDVGDERERVVKTLRLLVFTVPGNVCVVNELYADNGLDTLKTVDAEYTIRKRLRANLGEIRICFIANEPATWTTEFNRQGFTVTYDYLSELAIDYADRDYQFLSNNGTDMNLYTPDDPDNFLMYGGKIVNFIAGDVDAGTIGLDRTCAKVTLTLKYSDLIGSDNGGTFALTKAAIIYQPLWSRLTNHTGIVNYMGGNYLPTDYKDFRQTFAAPTTPIYTELLPISFYIPEFLLTDEEFSAGIYTYIEVLGVLTVGNVPQTITYKIPLGEGVQKLYDGTASSVDELAIGDFSIMRNHHYVVNGKVDNLGEKDGIQLQLAIKDWDEVVEVDVVDKAPYLNVSEIMLVRDLDTYNLVPDADNTLFTNNNDKIFFWSNQSALSVESVVCNVILTSDGSSVPFNEFFKTVDKPSSYSAKMIIYAPKEDGYFENNGYVDINALLNYWSDFKAQMGKFNRVELSFYIKAGNLRRKITYIIKIPTDISE